MGGVVVGAGKRLDKVGQRIATWLTSLLTSRPSQTDDRGPGRYTAWRITSLSTETNDS